MLNELRPAIVMIVLLTIAHRPHLSARHDRHRPGALPASGQRQPDRAGRQGDRLRADRPELHRATATSTAGRRRPATPIPTTRPRRCPRPTTRPTRRLATSGRPSKALIERVRATSRSCKAENPNAPVPVDLVTTSGSGLDPHISPAAALVPGAARGQGARPAGGPGARAGRRSTSRAAASASSASRASTCCSSTWRSTL